MTAIEQMHCEIANGVDVDDVPSFCDHRVPSAATPLIGSCWAVEAIGDPDTDWMRGEAYAEEALSYARRHQNRACIVYALAEIGRRKQFTYLELGFLDRISRAACAGTMN